MYELGGRLILHDLFSQPLTQIGVRTDQVKGKVEQLAATADNRLGPGMASGLEHMRQRFAQVEARLDNLQRKARQPVEPRFNWGPFRTFDDELRNAEGRLGSVGAGIKGLTGSFVGLTTAVAGSAAVLGALKLGRIALELAQVGAASESVERVFDNLTAAAGLNGQTMLREMRQASRGTVDEVTMMIAANRSLLAGGAEFAKVLPGLFEIAHGAAQATGQDVSAIFETLTKGIAKASPLLIDNAEIYIKVGRALDEYAAKQGKTVDMLSAMEQRAAMANIVLEQGSEFIKQMGLESATTADLLQNLPAAWRDVKAAIGEVVNDTGLPLWMAGFAEIARQFATNVSGARDLEKAIGELRLLGHAAEADRFATALARFQEAGTVEVQPGELPSEAATRWYEEQTAAAARAILAAKGYSQAQIDEAAAARAAARAQTELTEAMGPYTAALNEFRAKQAGPGVLMEQLGQMAGQMEAVRGQMNLPFPKLGETLWADTAALRAWVQALQGSGEALEQAKADTLANIDATEQWQLAQLNSLMTMENQQVALALLAQALLGPAASIEDLAEAYAKLPPAAQLAATQLGLFEQVLARTQARAADGVTVDVRLAGWERAMSELDSLALSLVGNLPAAQIREFRDTMRADFTEHWQEMGEIDQFGMDLQKAVILQGYRDIVDATKEKNKAIEQEEQRHSYAIYNSVSELSGAIERALQSGLEVSPLDMALTAAGKYEDKALENARRLDAIAQRGFDELKAHPDWAGLLKIPPDVLSGSEAELKAWAAQTRDDVQNLARPDLIDWDAFIDNFKRDLDREAAKELTLDIAVEKLDAAGLLKGLNKEEQKKKVAEMLGLEQPELTIAALLEAEKGAKQKLTNQATGGKGALDVPAYLRLMTTQEARDAAKKAAEQGDAEWQIEADFIANRGAAGDLVEGVLAGQPFVPIPGKIEWPGKEQIQSELNMSLDVQPTVQAQVTFTTTEAERANLETLLLNGVQSLPVPVTPVLPENPEPIYLPTLLQLSSDAGQQVINQVTGDQPYLPIPLQMQVVNAGLTAVGILSDLGLDNLVTGVTTNLLVAEGARERFLQDFLAGKASLEVPAVLVFPTPAAAAQQAQAAVAFTPPAVTVPLGFAVAPETRVRVEQDLLAGADALAVPVTLQYPNVADINAAIAAQLDVEAPPLQLPTDVEFTVTIEDRDKLLQAILGTEGRLPVPVAFQLPEALPALSVPLQFVYPTAAAQRAGLAEALAGGPGGPSVAVATRFTVPAGAKEQLLVDLLTGTAALAIPADVVLPDRDALAGQLAALATLTATLQLGVQLHASPTAGADLAAAVLAGAPALDLPATISYPPVPPALVVPVQLDLGSRDRLVSDVEALLSALTPRLLVATAFDVPEGAATTLRAELLEGRDSLPISLTINYPTRNELEQRLADIQALQAPSVTAPVVFSVPATAGQTVLQRLLDDQPALTVPVVPELPRETPVLGVDVAFHVPPDIQATLAADVLQGQPALTVPLGVAFPTVEEIAGGLAEAVRVAPPDPVTVPVGFTVPPGASSGLLAGLLAGAASIDVPLTPVYPLAVEPLRVPVDLAFPATEDMQAEIATAVSTAMPAVTLGTQFRVPPDALGTLAADLLGGQSALAIPTTFAFPGRTEQEALIATAMSTATPELAVSLRPTVAPGSAEQVIAMLLGGAAALPVPVGVQLQEGVDYAGQLVTALRLDSLTLSVRTQFALLEGAPAQLVLDLLQGQPALSVPVQFVQAPLAEAELGQGALAGLAPEQLAPPEQLLALSISGAAAAAALVTGFSEHLAGINIGVLVLQAWSLQFLGLAADFELMGRGAGKAVAKGFMQAVRADVGTVRQELAAIVAPEVAEILAARGRGKGAAE